LSSKAIIEEEVVMEVGSQGDGSGSEAIVEEEVDLMRSMMAKGPIQ
jgi:hypothetical protein